MTTLTDAVIIAATRSPPGVCVPIYLRLEYAVAIRAYSLFLDTVVLILMCYRVGGDVILIRKSIAAGSSASYLVFTQNIIFFVIAYVSPLRLLTILIIPYDRFLSNLVYVVISCTKREEIGLIGLLGIFTDTFCSVSQR